MRRQGHSRNLQKDIDAENAKVKAVANFADKKAEHALASKQDVRSGKRGFLRPSFPKKKLDNERSR